MRLKITHITRYLYPGLASDSHNELRLMPVTDESQVCLDFRLDVRPYARMFAYDLPCGRVHHFNLREPHAALAIRAESLVVTHERDAFASLQLVEDDFGFYKRDYVRRKNWEYLAPTARVPLDPETDRIAAVATRQAGPSTASFLVALTRLLHRVMDYAPGTTHVNTPLREVLENQRGVCQDFSHLMLAVCRRREIPCRYVSGYIYTRNAEDAEGTSGNMLDQNASQWHDVNDEIVQTSTLIGGDAMHAWVECLMPDGTWHGFDPTNNLVVDSHYVKVHSGRDYSDVTPVKGLFHGSANQTMETAVAVVKESI